MKPNQNIKTSWNSAIEIVVCKVFDILCKPQWVNWGQILRICYVCKPEISLNFVPWDPIEKIGLVLTGEFPAQRPVTRSFDVFFDLRLNIRLNTQSKRRWFETPWRHIMRVPLNIILVLSKIVIMLWFLFELRNVKMITLIGRGDHQK